MGIKSTIHLSLHEAIELYAEKRASLEIDMFRHHAAAMSCKEIEDALEEMNDKLHGGEGFENYNINL